jgi:hypothetical protein
MNWTWSLRSGDGGMNGLEFTRATTAGDLVEVLVHAAPAQLHVEVRRKDGEQVVAGEVERKGDYSPMTLLSLTGNTVNREEIWPTEKHYGLPVLLAGGEVGLLRDWHHADDHSWWKWQVEFSNHVGRPDDWAPPD